MFDSFRFNKTETFKVGGYARNKFMGSRIMKVKCVELPDYIVLETYGQTNRGKFSYAKRPRTTRASILHGWYEPVEKVIRLQE